jgi:hypothetical protein
MSFVVSIISSGVHEGDLAIKAFEAIRIIRERYGLEIVVDFVNYGLSGCGAFCGPPVIALESGRSFALADDRNYEAEDLAEIIVKLIFGEVENEKPRRLSAHNLGGPEASVGALAA